MVVLPDVRGLHQFYKELAQRFAEAGIDSVAIDYFARTAGRGDRSEGFDFMPHVQATTPEGIAADTAAAIAHLKSKDGGQVKSVFTVGFCFGGSNSWNQSAANPELNGCIGFYGRPSRSEPHISKMKAPLLILIAGADQATTPEQNQEFRRMLEAAAVAGSRVDHELLAAAAGLDDGQLVPLLREGAPHSFFDRSFEQWKDACDDAWRRILDFVKKHS